MSYDSRRYSEFSTFFREISPSLDLWDKQIHVHATEEIFLFTQPGSCRMINNGITVDIPTPAFIWNRAGAFHHVVSYPDLTDSYVLSYHPQVLHTVPDRMIKTDFLGESTMFALTLDFKCTDRLSRLFHAIIGSPIFQRQLLLPCIFHQVTQGVESGIEPIRVSNSSVSYIGEVIKLLQSPTPEKLTTEVLAKRFHVGQTKLKSDFKKITNMPIHTFRLREQVRTARMQMATSTEPLAKIAVDCGFTDESHLIRAFRAEYGFTPGVFRKKYMGDFRNAEHQGNRHPV